MKKLLFFIALFLGIFSYSQNVTLQEITSALQEKNLKDLKANLSQIGWTNQDNITKETTNTSIWQKEDCTLYIYNKKGQIAGCDLETLNREIFVNIKNSLSPEGFVFIESGLENNIEKTFLNNPTQKLNLTVMVSTTKIGAQNQDVYTLSFSYSNPVDGLVRKQTKDGLVEYTVVNGLPHGWYISYYDNGNIRYITFYQGGVEKGIRKEYYQDGVLKESKNIDGENVTTSKITYYPNGNKELEAIYKNSKAEGLWLVYHPTGEKKSEIPYKNDKIDGVVKEFYKNGKVETIYTYKNGILEGPSIWYFENGDKEIETSYKNGKQNGYRNLYYEDGSLKSSSSYKDDILDGISSTFFPDGKTLTELTYSNGVKVQMKRFDPNGKLNAIFVYKGNNEEEYSIDNELVRRIERFPTHTVETLFHNGKISEQFVNRQSLTIYDSYAYFKSGNLARVLRSITLKGQKQEDVIIFFSKNSRRLLYPDGSHKFLNLNDDKPFTGTFEYFDESNNIREIRSVENGKQVDIKHL